MNNKKIKILVPMILFLLLINGLVYIMTNGVKRGIIVESAFFLLEIIITIWLMKDVWNSKS
ncbi:hypothetical protein [Lachnospira sp.]|jgi:hypothetical protein|uniref:hypothetical protein n=1 Tax=Lachnospira sp. TaxID=2049031 RepID=UPI0025799CE9|nr:hypothetical protein [Lachnospira sp.]